MAQNISIQRFKQLTDDLKRDVHNAAVAELHTQAARLKDLIKSVAPVYQGSTSGEGPSAADIHPGALKESVRAIPDRGGKDTVVRIVAGGPLTVHTSLGAGSYDYSRAEEFGTHRMKAHPFFFPTYRLMKPTIVRAMKRKIADQIRKYSAEGGKGNV